MKRLISLGFRLLPAFALLAAGCGSPYVPPVGATVPASSASAADYPLRTDWMATKLPDGAPPRWPSPGFPPLRSAANPNGTPDRDIADELRKQPKNILDPTKELTASQAAVLGASLEAAFGTPAEPRVRVLDWNGLTVAAVVRPKPASGVLANLGAAATALKKWKSAPVKVDWDSALAAKAKLGLDDAAVARGGVLYRRWCLSCHGPTGGGDGAHAIRLNAMPRDYRQGVFKFVTAFPDPAKNTKRKGRGPSGKPLREDLERTISKGLDGSMMPAFPTLTRAELEDLVSYVIHLSVRGETEFATLASVLDPQSEDDYGTTGPALAWLFEQNLMWVLHNWGVAAGSRIDIPQETGRPADDPTPLSPDDRAFSALRGYYRYHSAEFGCAACHVKYGTEPQLKWDFWGTVVQPRNLVLGVYRGGRDGRSLYARLYGGIYPSGMTAFHTTLNGESYLDRPNKIWNVVHFLHALADPYDRQRLQDPALLTKFKERLKADSDSSMGNPDDLKPVRLDL